MSYNIQAGAGHLDSTAQAIREQSPDIVALQEVDVHWSERSHFADEAAELGRMLGMQSRFAYIYRMPAAGAKQPPREYGVALLSRFPITSWRNDKLTRLSTQETNPTPTPMPGMLDATIDVNGQSVRIFTTHLDYRADPGVRTTQVAEMMRLVTKSSVPMIVAGDLNATPDAAELQPLLHALHDCWAAVNTEPGFTYPSEAPVKRIDYVLVSPQFAVRSARVPDARASDHRPVVVELRLGGR
jgi:endonuclease/exonuclease/phosphatase family metal-dependent hydrolase